MKSVQQPASVAAAHAELAAEQEGPVALLKAFLRMNANGSEAGSSALTSAGKSEQVLDAYGEYCQRRDAGEPLNPDEYLAKFPHLRSRLARLISAHRLLENNPHLLDPQASVKWPLAGERFLGFQLHRELGRGAFARVFLATEPALGNRQVAVKLSLGGGAEAETLGRLGGHPNIVPVYSAPEDSATGLTAVCMPYLGSATLEDLLDRLKALPALPRGADIITHAVADQFPPGVKHPESPGQLGTYVDAICHIGAQLAEALEFIHGQDVLHRDLKPSNVLMMPDGRPMLLDFNLSKDPQATDSRLGGTLPYMAPEQLRATDQESRSPAPSLLDARSDVYSLGVMLYELLTGKHPFGPILVEWNQRETWEQLLKRQQGPLTPIRQLNPDVEPRVALLVERCLAADPALRPQQARELARGLGQRRSRLRRMGRCVARHVWLSALAAALTIGLSTAAAVWWAQGAAARSAEWQQGQKAYQEGNYAEAVKQYNKLLESYPDNADLLTALGRSYQQWGESDGKKFDFALNAYERAHAVRPDGRLSACMAYCWQRLGKTELAGHNLDAAQQQGFASAGFYNNLAYFYLKNGNKCDQAIEHLDKAISANGELRAAYHNRALAYFQKVIMSGGLNPPINKGPAPANQGAQALHLKWLQQAKSDMQKALRGGGSLEGFRDAARIWGLCTAYDPGDADQALTYLERAAKLGLAPSVLREDAVLQPLSGHERFQKLLTGQVAVQPTVPTTRIVDPWQQ